MKKTVKRVDGLKITRYTRVLHRGSKVHGYPRIVAVITEVEVDKR